MKLLAIYSAIYTNVQKINKLLLKIENYRNFNKYHINDFKFDTATSASTKNLKGLRNMSEEITRMFFSWGFPTKSQDRWIIIYYWGKVYQQSKGFYIKRKTSREKKKKKEKIGNNQEYYFLE